MKEKKKINRKEKKEFQNRFRRSRADLLFPEPSVLSSAGLSARAFVLVAPTDDSTGGVSAPAARSAFFFLLKDIPKLFAR